MRRYVLLILWFLGILFPLAWLGRFSQTYHQVFNQIFEPEWMHIAMHTLLYAGLSLLIVFAFGLQCNRRSFLRIILIIIIVGIFQEGIQFISQGSLILSHHALRIALFDLIVDIIGGVIGFMIAAGLQWNRRKIYPAAIKSRS